jgi:hypothetical protein
MTDPIPKPRWYRLTPDCFVVGLLAVECLLWLSEWFQWFSFNHHKGWTVLIAVAVVGVAALLMPLWLAVALFLRWRFQFSIRSMFVLTAVVAILCSWLTMERDRMRRQKEAVAWIENAGGTVVYDWQTSLDARNEAPGWLRYLLTDDFFDGIADVYFGGADVSFIRYQKGITDDGLEHLIDLRELDWLRLDNTQITDATLEYISGLRHLRYVSVNGTHVTDAGLEHLKGAAQLQELSLVGTQVTDAGVQRLQQSLPKCKIYY